VYTGRGMPAVPQKLSAVIATKPTYKTRVQQLTKPGFNKSLESAVTHYALHAPRTNRTNNKTSPTSTKSEEKPA
jgi:hypothetical protein